jgi:hypothetical protein
MALENLVVEVIAMGFSLTVLFFVFAYITSPLNTFPGPFWAKFTDIWRLLDYWCCTQIRSHQELHKAHGVAVRIGPNMVSLSDPALIKKVYSTRGDFVKVCDPGYPVWLSNECFDAAWLTTWMTVINIEQFL